MHKIIIKALAAFSLSTGALANSEGKHLGELVIKRNPNLPNGSLKNAISISAPLHVIMCDMTKPNTCDIPRTVMCVRMGD